MPNFTMPDRSFQLNAKKKMTPDKICPTAIARSARMAHAFQNAPSRNTETASKYCCGGNAPPSMSNGIFSDVTDAEYVKIKTSYWNRMSKTYDWQIGYRLMTFYATRFKSENGLTGLNSLMFSATRNSHDTAEVLI